MDTWTNYSPQQAADLKLDLSVRLDIAAPINELGERCPWPWDPQQLVGSPLGQYHCPYCGGMVLRLASVGRLNAMPPCRS